MKYWGHLYEFDLRAISFSDTVDQMAFQDI